MAVSGKSCIITGAAGGIGLAIAQRFAEAGAKVMLADLDEDALHGAADAMTKDGYDVQFFVGDLSQKLSVANLLSATIDANERIDILVNGSRVLESDNGENIDAARLTKLFEQNVAANLRLSEAVAGRMVKQAEDTGADDEETGAIVNITSITADRTLRDLAGYSVACAALNQLTRALAISLAPKGIRVNAVALGSVMSSWMRVALKADPELRNRVVGATPLGRIGEAEEAANTALFLASDQASFITGQILACDGGRSMLEPVALPTY